MRCAGVQNTGLPWYTCSAGCKVTIIYIGPRTLHCMCTKTQDKKLFLKYLVVSSFFANFEPK